MLGEPNGRASTDQTRGGGQPSLADLVLRYGFRHVHGVHVVVDPGHQTVAEVMGVVHRYPRSVRVPLSVASRLVSAGAPLTIERVRSLVPEDA